MKAKLLSSVVTGCLVIVGTAGATSLLVVGCGGDDSISPPADAGFDQSIDSPIVDARTDTSIPDSATDSPTADSPTTADGGVDSGDSAVEADAMPTLPTAAGFAPELTQVYCQRIQYCCDIDAGDFSLAGCVDQLDRDPNAPLGTGEATAYLDSGLVAYNAVQAQQCLNDMANFPCGTVNAMQNVALSQACVAAFSGTQTQNGPCVDSIECPSTDYCQLPGDGDAGACQPLAGDGGTCTVSSQCSYLGLGSPALYCEPSTGTCMPLEPAGATCNSYRECASGICPSGNPRTCGSMFVFTDQNVPGGTCAHATVMPDAGGD